MRFVPRLGCWLLCLQIGVGSVEIPPPSLADNFVLKIDAVFHVVVSNRI